MSYAIGHVVYGYDLTGEKLDSLLRKGWKKSNPKHRLDCDDIDIFIETIIEEYLCSAYSGNGEYQPCWLGVKLGTIDECSSICVEDIPKFNAEQLTTFTQQLEQLPKWVSDIISHSFKQSTWIIWGTS